MNAPSSTLPVPPFFDPSTVGDIWQVPYLELAAAAESWAREHRVTPSAADKRRTCLLLVDAQISFCVPDSDLFVGGRSGLGAVEDNVRLCKFIYENLNSITEVIATLDTHTATQIFHPVFWVNEAGEHPAPHTQISASDLEHGAWKVNPAMATALEGGDLHTLEEHVVHYVNRLDQGGKYPLIIWPYHGMLGGIGHALVPAVEAACFFHSIARSTQTIFETKGDNPLTENYSVLGAEVQNRADGSTLARKNARLIERLLGLDAVIIAGQAKSHCVAWTVADLLDEIAARDKGLAGKIYLLEDCTSAVVVPGVVDFTEQADEALRRFVAAGMHAARSTTAIREWPGMGR